MTATVAGDFSYVWAFQVVAKKTATQAAVAAIRPMIATIQYHQGLPAGFWKDHYVVGFFHFMIGFNAKIATRGRITGEALGYAMRDVLTSISNMNGAELTRRATELALNPDSDFNKGADDAATLCLYSIKRLTNEADNPLVRAATDLANKTAGDMAHVLGKDELGEQGRRSGIAALMLMLTLHKEIRERFSSDLTNADPLGQGSDATQLGVPDAKASDGLRSTCDDIKSVEDKLRQLGYDITPYGVGVALLRA